MSNSFFTWLVTPLKGKGLRKYKVVRFALTLTRPRTVSINGLTLFVDRSDAVITGQLTNGAYEPLETDIISKLVQPGFTILDIGANIGYYTTLLSRKTGDTGGVHAFEPFPQSAALLMKNLAVNNCTNVVVHQIALSREKGEKDLYLNGYNTGDNRLYASEGMNHIAVRTDRLDDVLPPGVSVDLIKMDIQGSEWNALQGMAQTLAAHQPLLISEFWPLGLLRAGGSARVMLEFLEGLGYAFIEINEGAHSYKATSMEMLLTEYPETKEAFTNILCVPKSDSVSRVLSLLDAVV